MIVLTAVLVVLVELIGLAVLIVSVLVIDCVGGYDCCADGLDCCVYRFIYLFITTDAHERLESDCSECALRSHGGRV